MLHIGRLAAWAALLAAAAPAKAADVIVTITGVEDRGGALLAALQTEEEFLQSSGTYGAMITDVAPGEAVLTIMGVAPGRYSLSVMHDENGDYQMQRQEDGRPTEGWAMIGGAELTRAPTFEGASFLVGDQDVTIRETMIYPGG